MSNHSATTHEPKGNSLARTFDDDRYAWTRVARTRRRSVVAEAGLLTALCVLTVMAAFADGGLATWHVVVWTVGLLAFVPLHSMLNTGIRGLYDRSGRTLDEHQNRLRERSHAAVRWPANALTLAACTSAVGVVAATDDTEYGLALGFLLWFAASLLPYWHLGWTLADEAESPELP